MKFGEYLTEKKELLPEQWAQHCIDYNTLKSFIKRNLDAADRINSHDSITDLPAQLGRQLSILQIQAPLFVSMLNACVDKMDAFYSKIAATLSVQFEDCLSKSNSADSLTLKCSGGLIELGAVTDSQFILRDIVKLENFVFLNYTAIVKILKKFDRRSGLEISKRYLTSLTDHAFYKSENIIRMKPTLLNNLGNGHLGSGQLTPAEQSFPSSLPPLIRGQIAKTNWLPPKYLYPNQKVLVTMSGPHGTDIIGAVLNSIALYNAKVEDFMLSRLQHDVTFGCLITLTSDDIGIVKDLSDHASTWDATLHFSAQEKTDIINSLEDAPYNNRTKFTATVLNQFGLTAQFLYDWTRMLLDWKISVEKMVRLSSENSFLTCADFKLSIPGDVDIDAFRGELFKLSRKYGTDVALQPHNVFRKNKRLVIFDMDSTLIQQEVIDEIARHAGVMESVAQITEAAMNGEIDFKESLRRRVALLKGTPVRVLDTIKENLIFTEGALFLCNALKKLGYKLAVISGGFMPLALYVKNQLGLDYAFANTLKVSPDGLTFIGETVGPIVDGVRKAELLEVIAQAESVTTEQVIAVGDGANDLLMLAAAGLGIAFNAKPRVQEKARARINQKSLKNVLYLLGYSDEDALQLI